MRWREPCPSSGLGSREQFPNMSSCRKLFMVTIGQKLQGHVFTSSLDPFTSPFMRALSAELGLTVFKCTLSKSVKLEFGLVETKSELFFLEIIATIGAQPTKNGQTLLKNRKACTGISSNSPFSVPVHVSPRSKA